ncbi:hypothetical protein MTO96_017236 [Rhipicephalus appendiculatus]
MAAAALPSMLTIARRNGIRRYPTPTDPCSNENNAGAVERRRTLPAAAAGRSTRALRAPSWRIIWRPSGRRGLVLDERMSSENVTERRQGHPYANTRASKRGNGACRG